MSQSVLVTGAAGGIGSAIANLFKESGWYVFATDIEPPPQTKASFDHFITADLSDPKAIEHIYSEVSKEKNSLEALVNNAAVQSNSAITDLTLAEWDTVQAVNLRAPCFLTKVFTPYLQKNGGAVINISSIHAQQTSENISAYAAAKGGLVSFTRAAALELAKLNIRANVICPGAIDTSMLREGFKRGQHGQSDEASNLKSLREKHPLGRIGLPQEIAELTLFLADSQKSGFLTGQTITVDGGASARLSTE